MASLVLSLSAEQEVFSAIVDKSLETNSAARRFETLEDAIDAALASECPRLDIAIRPGEYRPASTIDLDVTGLQFTFRSESGQAKIVAPAPGDTIMNLNGRAGKATLQNLALVGNVQFGDAETMDCAWTVESCRIEGAGDHCIIAGGHSSSVLTVKNCQLENKGQRKDGIQFWEPKGRLLVEGCTIAGCNNGIMTGFYEQYSVGDVVSDGMRADIKGNHISDCVNGARVYPGVTGTMSDNHIWNCKEAVDLVTETVVKGKRELPGFVVSGPEPGAAPAKALTIDTSAGGERPAPADLFTQSARSIMSEDHLKGAEEKYSAVESDKARLASEVARLEKQLDLAFAMDRAAWDNHLRTIPPEALDGVRTRLLAIFDRVTQMAVRAGTLGGAVGSNGNSACGSPRAPRSINIYPDGVSMGGLSTGRPPLSGGNTPTGAGGMVRVPSSELLGAGPRRRSNSQDGLGSDRRGSGSYDATSPLVAALAAGAPAALNVNKAF
eukprot:tig00020553_g10682.t1